MELTSSPKASLPVFPTRLWAGQEGIQPCFQAERVHSATGAGDTSIVSEKYIYLYLKESHNETRIDRIKSRHNHMRDQEWLCRFFLCIVMPLLKYQNLMICSCFVSRKQYGDIGKSRNETYNKYKNSSKEETAMPNWVSAFHIAQRGIFLESNNGMERTVRVVFPNNLNGQAVRLVLSNKYSDTPARVSDLNLATCDENGIIDCDSITALTFQGENEVVLGPGEEKISDEIKCEVRAGSYLAVSMYFPDKELLKSGSSLGTAEYGGYTLRSEIGNYTRTADMPLNNETDAFVRQAGGDQAADAPLFRSLDILTEEGCNVAMLGDSVTQMCYWYKPFTKRLYDAFPGKISTGNQGIGGSRMCYDSPASFFTMFGDAAYKRFQDEVLTLSGLKYVLVSVGGNDLGIAGTDIAGVEEMLTMEQYQSACRTIVEAAHKKGVKVYACTITPNEIQEKGNTADREILRREINHWIKTTELFDGVFDFAEIVGRGEEPGLRPEYNFGDGCHLNEAGGKAVANNINLSVFA